jgi:hypothetical protein
LVGRDIEPVCPGILDQQILALDAVVGDLRQSVVAPDAVVLVNDEVAGAHLGEEGARGLRTAGLTTALAPAEDLGVGEDGQRHQPAVPALGEAPMHDGERANPWWIGQISGRGDEQHAVRAEQRLITKQLSHAPRLCAYHHNPLPFQQELAHVLREGA